MARQVVFKQTSGNKSEHRKCANKFKQQIKQSNRSSNQTDQANKQIKQTNRSSNQTDQANKQIKQTNGASEQIKQTNKIATGSIHLALSKPSRQVEIKRTSGSQASVEYRPEKSNKEYEAIEQNRQNRQAAAIPAPWHDESISASFPLKRNASSVASKNSQNITPRAQRESSSWDPARAGGRPKFILSSTD